jgi:hypothetical protein
MLIAGLRFLRITLWLVCAACVAIPSLARSDETLDGRGHPVQDELLDSLVGSWKLIRTMHGQTFENTVQAEWVLEHQFLRLHYRDVGSPAKYEAMAFIGYDHAAQSYIVHWIDVLALLSPRRSVSANVKATPSL